MRLGKNIELTNSVSLICSVYSNLACLGPTIFGHHYLLLVCLFYDCVWVTSKFHLEAVLNMLPNYDITIVFLVLLQNAVHRFNVQTHVRKYLYWLVYNVMIRSLL